jgi:replication factor C subunit 1
LQIALEELAERVNGDMRMALNQLQYMSLSMPVINYDDVRQRLQGSAKDEDISPFTAVDKYDLMIQFLPLQCCFRCSLFKVMMS